MRSIRESTPLQIHRNALKKTHISVCKGVKAIYKYPQSDIHLCGQKWYTKIITMKGAEANDIRICKSKHNRPEP